MGRTIHGSAAHSAALGIRDSRGLLKGRLRLHFASRSVDPIRQGPAAGSCLTDHTHTAVDTASWIAYENCTGALIGVASNLIARSAVT
jgi:hypothetical protein